MSSPTLSLIITTYNWPQALDLVLQSIRIQSLLPNEVIIADDGSKKATSDLIALYQKNFPVPLIHSWQEDRGFRLSRSRNLAIAKAKGDYIVMVDGDMILHPHFIRDHNQTAKPHQFIQGRRVILTKSRSQQAFVNQKCRFFPLMSGLNNKINAISIPFLSAMFSPLFSKQSYSSVRGCNMSMWRADLIAVNGFNEDFEGWGREDSELVLRMLNRGIKRYDLRLGAVAYHLYHPDKDRSQLNKNDEFLTKAIAAHAQHCPHGLDSHL